MQTLEAMCAMNHGGLWGSPPRMFVLVLLVAGFASEIELAPPHERLWRLPQAAGVLGIGALLLAIGGVRDLFRACSRLRTR
jgi:hypothetical protein